MDVSNREIPGFPAERAAGILLHPTSLPGPVVGDIGPAAHRWIDWLADAGHSYWQILPLVPVDDGGSPYNGLSAVAGNPLLISPEGLVEEGLLRSADIADPPGASAPSEVDFPTARAWKKAVLRLALGNIRGQTADEFEAYRAENGYWLRDYALFRALRDLHGRTAWTSWPEALRERDPDSLHQAEEEQADQVRAYEFEQFLFERQWTALAEHARERGIRIVGDLPIFVAHDSADVWSRPELFQLGPGGQPSVVAGVPPDYFSETGQRWGNPLYRWDRMAESHYAWWVLRFRRTLRFVDLIRIDHFRGFESFWEIPASEETAVRGRWEQGPGEGFFADVERQTGTLPLIAEDLGIITREVEELRDRLGLPGMRVLQFAFDGDPHNPHLPPNHPRRSVAYTGTHDNDTLVGWIRSLSGEDRQRVAAALRADAGDRWTLIQYVYRSAAALAVIPMQDALGLGSEARMNVPGEPAANWRWRLYDFPDRDLARHLRQIAEKTNRA